MVIGGTIFPHKPCHKATWRSPDARTENQIDHITINQQRRSSLQDVRVKRSADQVAMWQILPHYRVPGKIINNIWCLYSSFECQEIHNGSLTEPFQGRTGVRRGCLLLPIIFLVVLDWVTRQAYGTGITGKQWILTWKLEDLDFTDDLCLLTHKLKHMQEKMIALQGVSARVGLKINTGKTREMRIHVRDGNPLHAGNEDIQQADNFTYLGSIVNVTEGTEEDITACIRKA